MNEEAVVHTHTHTHTHTLECYSVMKKWGSLTIVTTWTDLGGILSELSQRETNNTVRWLSQLRLFATPRAATRHASLCFTTNAEEKRSACGFQERRGGEGNVEQGSQSYQLPAISASKVQTPWCNSLASTILQSSGKILTEEILSCHHKENCFPFHSFYLYCV